MIDAVYLLVLGLLGIFGLHRSWLVWTYLRRTPTSTSTRTSTEPSPVVTVQLPIFNELAVAERLIDAVAAIRWPRLEIQVLDDSEDETVEICARKVAELREKGIDAVHVRRGTRQGFKAGALQNGLHTAKGELICIFDADFLPDPDVLERAVPAFSDLRVAMVQLRWGHLNREASWLTRAQALLLDGHFAVEHGARHAAGRFFNFSGTAGVWRRAAIVDAGGWQHDTLTEDMDLSYRAQLRGWRFVYLDGAEVPAELPADMAAFRSQQFRWAKGQTQVARKLLPSVVRARLPLAVKLEAGFHLANNVAYILLLALGLLMLPQVVAGGPPPGGAALEALVLAVGTGSVAAFYLAARGGRALSELPLVMALCCGLALSQSRAVVEALAGRASGFVRTPKRGAGGPVYPSPPSRLPLVELTLAGYFALTAALAAAGGRWATLPFALLFAAGFAAVALASGKKNGPSAEPMGRGLQ